LTDNISVPAIYLRTVEAILLHRQGDWSTAAQQLGEIVLETIQQGNIKYFGIAGYYLVEVLVDLQAYDEIKQLLENVQPFLDKASGPGDFHTLIVASIKLGNLDQARGFLTRARDLSSPNIGLIDQSLLLLDEALIATEERRWLEAFKGFNSAAQNFAHKDMLWDLARTRCAWADAHLKRGKPKDIQEGRKLLGETLALYQKMGAKKHTGIVEVKLKTIRE